MIEITKEENICKDSFSPTIRLHLKNNDLEYHRDYVERKEAVTALVYDTKLRKYIFVNQFRPGTRDHIIETVAGMIEPELGISPEDTMKKEILEEIGYKTDYINFINKSFTAPGYSDEVIYYYYVEVSDRVSKGGGLRKENEFIEIIEMEIEDIFNYSFLDAKCNYLLGVLGIKNFDRW